MQLVCIVPCNLHVVPCEEQPFTGTTSAWMWQSPHHRRFSRCDWTRCWRISSWPPFPWKVGSDGPLIFLSIWAVLQLYESSQVGKKIRIYKCNGHSQTFYNGSVRLSLIIKKERRALCSTSFHAVNWEFPLFNIQWWPVWISPTKPHTFFCFSCVGFLLGFAESARASPCLLLTF